MSGITDPAEAYFKDGVWTWDGSQWRKQPHVWGYSDRYAELVSNTSLPAGTSDVDGSTVPADEVWVVKGLCVTVVSGSITSFRFSFYNGASRVDVDAISSPVSGLPYGFQGEIVLKEGDYVKARVYGATLNDDCYLNAWGYKMKIAE